MTPPDTDADADADTDGGPGRSIDGDESDGTTNGGRGRGPPEDRSVADLLRFGVINLDKPAGPSAHQVSAWVRDMVDETLAAIDAPPAGRAAHAGTLDPKVTGCLPVLLGEATRVAQALTARKEYVAVLELHGRAPADLEEVLAEFEGPLYQKPPRKSAVARRLRVREVYDLTTVERESRRALIRIDCESGTYVRKLCHDLGLALGTGAHMGHLRRTASAPFDDRDLVTLQTFADALAFAREGDADLLREVVAPAERALVGLPRVRIAASAAAEVATGAPVYAPGVLGVAPPPGRDGGAQERPETHSGSDGRDRVDPSDDDLVVCVTPDDAAVCLGRLVGDPDAERGTVVDLERVLV
jgi:tRNA pseudouridine55 synthase